MLQNICNNRFCRSGDVGGGVQDPDQPQHLPRLPAPLLGPGQHWPQPGRDEEGGVPGHDEAGHAPRVGGQGAPRRPGQADGRVLVPGACSQTHRPQDQEKLPENTQHQTQQPGQGTGTALRLKYPTGTNLIKSFKFLTSHDTILQCRSDAYVCS